MTTRKSILIIMVLLLCSCNGKKEEQETEPKPEQVIESRTELELNNDYSKSAELFVKEVLNDNIRIHSFNLASSEKPKHLRIFQFDGLEKIIAYSNKNYPKNSEPTYYEHFTLFVATFNNQKSAEENFDLIKSDSKYGLSEWNELEEGLSERVESLNAGAKPGGMIVQRGKYVLSLVETCRKTPVGGSWKDYENKFIGFLTEDDEEIEVLNSDCGMDRYIIDRIKAIR